jgi:hypothetical protein
MLKFVLVKLQICWGLSLATTKEHVGVFLNKVSQYGLSVPFWASFSRTINDKELMTTVFPFYRTTML